jgi:putative heme-binding domain-containing protein
LLASRDPELQKRAKSLLTVPAAGIEAVRRKYADVLTLAAEPHRGRTVFEKNCATCHRIGTIGVDVGPDIADSRTKTPQQLLTDILEPNRAIDANFIGYLIVTSDGLTLNGILSSETGTSITLRQAENKVVSLLRSDIAELRATGLSLMPEGWDRTITPQDMADLISFIKNWRYLDGLTPLENAKSGM